MPTWDDAYLDRLKKEAEREIARQFNFIWGRYPIAITAGTATYTLPDYIRGITDVRWKGDKVYPLYQSEAITIDHSYLTTRGNVRWYMRSPEDFQIIRFIKVPNETITADPDNDDCFDDTVISARVIISYYREPDTSGNLLSLPDYVARRMVKNYVLYRAFAREGDGQNLNASNYYKEVYESQLDNFKLLYSRFTMGKKKLTSPSDALYEADFPQLRRDFTITKPPFTIHLGIPDSLEDFDDDVNSVLS